MGGVRGINPYGVLNMKYYSLPVAALLLFASFSASTMAASVGTSTDATGAVSGTTSKVAGSASANTGLNANLSDQSNFADVMGSLTTSDAASVDLSTVDWKRAKIVRISKLKGYTASGLKTNAAGMQQMAALDAKVAADANLSAALKKAGYQPSEVVAVSSNAQGNAVVFIAK